MSDDPATRFRENATEITSMVVTGVWLALLFLPGVGRLWLPVMLFGYIVVVPLVALLFGDESDREEWWEWWDDESWEEWWGSDTDSSDDPQPATGESDRSNNADALETLRERYAAGELTDDQFERKLDRLLETGTLEDADAWARERGREADREREPEYDR